ncbi:MAG: DUF6766 family protein [Fibrobacteria bacterium]
MPKKGSHGFWKSNGLSAVYLALFLGAFGAQSLAGWLSYNEDQRSHSEPTLAYSSYWASAHFWQSVGENWESEFLQMGTYVLFTVFFFQKGSSESKDPDKEEEVDKEPDRRRLAKGVPWPVHGGGWIYGVYKHSLTLAFLILFLLSFALHAGAGVRKFNAEAGSHGQSPLTLAQYLVSAEFWFESMQNWQSEFLAVFSMVTLSIFLRQKGSPESKPLAAAHSETGK